MILWSCDLVMKSVEDSALVHWWSQASYGPYGSWSHVNAYGQQVAPWMLLMVIVFGIIYAVDAVVASIAVLTTLRDSYDHAHKVEEDHHDHDNHASESQEAITNSIKIGRQSMLTMPKSGLQTLPPTHPKTESTNQRQRMFHLSSL